MQKPTIAITAPGFCSHSPDLFNELKSRFNVKVLKSIPFTAGEDELVAALKDIDGVVLGLQNFTRKVIEGISNLKIICRYGIGFENVDVKAASSRKIIVTCTRGVREEISVAEHTIALILAAAKKIPTANSFSLSGKWATSPSERPQLSGRELYEKVLGVIGLGNIGKKVAEIAKNGFKMTVTAYDPYIDEREFVNLGVKKAGNLEELIKSSDIITLHAPLTNETYHLIDKNMFEKMKKDVIIVNTARGALIDESALYEFLKNNPQASAALDVLSDEPPRIDNPLMSLPNIIITPHTAAFTHEALNRMDKVIIEDLTNFFFNKKLPPTERIVNKEILQNYVL
jgi:D-3-phosphoglycerate dehydrogenase